LQPVISNRFVTYPEPSGAAPAQWGVNTRKVTSALLFVTCY
jgi:hypothetical protein